MFMNQQAALITLVVLRDLWGPAESQWKVGGGVVLLQLHAGFCSALAESMADIIIDAHGNTHKVLLMIHFDRIQQFKFAF